MQSIVRQLLLFISCLLLLLSVVQAAPVRPPSLGTASANPLTNAFTNAVLLSIFHLRSETVPGRIA